MTSGRPVIDESGDAMLQRPVVVSAPGKVILFGEHSVVYGKQSLAFSLGLRTELTISPLKDAVELHLPEIDVEQSWPLPTLKRLWEKLKVDPKSNGKAPKPMSAEEETIIRSFLGANNPKELVKSDLGLLTFFHMYTTILSHPIPFSIKVRSQMPVGAGLGSSGAYAVCLTAALLWISGQIKATINCLPDKITLSHDILNTVSEWAFISEKIIHSTPSGIDNTICAYGGGISFKDGKIQVFNPPTLTIMLVNTRVSRNTKTLIAAVRDKHDRLVPIIKPLLNSMDSLAESGLQILNEMKANGISNQALNRKFSHLNELIDMNQCLLSALGVSHPSLDVIVSVAKSHGLHAKLTGAGGGGFGLILLPPETPQTSVEACKRELETKGFEAWITRLGSEGLRFSFPE